MGSGPTMSVLLISNWNKLPILVIELGSDPMMLLLDNAIVFILVSKPMHVGTAPVSLLLDNISNVNDDIVQILDGITLLNEL